MFRKLVVRLFLCVVGLVAVVVLAGCLVGYFALQQPAFYSELRAHSISESEQQAAKGSWDLMERDLQLWCARSQALQHTARPATSLTAAKHGATPGELTQGRYLLTVTETQINALLASTGSGNGEWQNPRIHFGPGSAEIGFEFIASQVNFVLSAELKPTINSAGRLRLDLVSAHIGRIPLPMKRIFGWLPPEAYHTGNDVELNLSDPTPHICVDLSSNAPNSPIVESIQCVEGTITIELLPPEPKRQHDERHATPLALSGE